MNYALTTIAATLVMHGTLTAAELPKSLLDPYLQVQVALAGDTVEGVSTHAKAIETAAAALGGDAGRIAAGARKLQGVRDIAAARTAFGEVSDALMAYAEKSKAELPADVRVAFCPMANKAWLQKEKEIRNPYYGASMISCGSFQSQQ